MQASLQALGDVNFCARTGCTERHAIGRTLLPPPLKPYPLEVEVQRMTAALGGRARLGHVRGLDGVRGLAILLVLMYHGGHEFAVGGQQGVTVFFVLSGFLITSLLLDESSRSGSVDVRRFYRRRVARLGPALLVVLAVESLWVAMSGQPDRWRTVATGLSASLTSTANLVMVVADPARLGDAYGWAWSLSIEEQFYLVWIPLLVLGLRRGWSVRLLVIPPTVLCLTSMIIRSGVSQENGTKLIHAFFGTDTRMDALFAGCLLALVLSRTRLPTTVGFLGIPALLTLAYVARFGGETLRSTYVLWMPCVVAATVCLIAASVAAPSSITARVLSLSILVRLGELSYGVYLWNVFVRDFVASWLGEDPWELPLAALVVWGVLTVLIAEVSLRKLELPIRLRAARSNGRSPSNEAGGKLARHPVPT